MRSDQETNRILLRKFLRRRRRWDLVQSTSPRLKIAWKHRRGMESVEGNWVGCESEREGFQAMAAREEEDE